MSQAQAAFNWIMQIDFQARDKRVAIEFVDPAGKHAQTLASI
jgi:hypothetical protein